MSDPVNTTPETIPMSLILLRAPVGSSQFEITTENCDPLQLFGAAEIIRIVGMQAFAAAQGASVAAQMEQRPAIVPARRMPS